MFDNFLLIRVAVHPESNRTLIRFHFCLIFLFLLNLFLLGYFRQYPIVIEHRCSFLAFFLGRRISAVEANNSKNGVFEVSNVFAFLTFINGLITFSFDSTGIFQESSDDSDSVSDLLNQS